MEEGTILRNNYRLERLLGRGGTADVYLAFDIRRQTYVAIKVLREDLADDAEFVRRFSREAVALARLDHPYIVRFYSFERDGAMAFIVLDYVPGSNLQRRLIEAGSPLPLAEITGILSQVGAALQYAHGEGYIHRDIKPGNIMLREDGTALLSDFGIARASELSTASTATIGTPAYMSPEQILGYDLDARTDIYSLGIVLYEMATGHRAFTGDERLATGTGTLARLRDAHLRLMPPNPLALNPALPPAAADVIQRALAKNPVQRWPDVISLTQAWEQAVGPAPRAAKPGPAPAAAAPLTPGAAALSAGGVSPQQPATPARLAPAGPMPVSQVQRAERRPSRAPWVALGVVLGLVILGLAAWRFLLPALSATARPTATSAPTADLPGTAQVLIASYGTATAQAQATAQSATSEAARQGQAAQAPWLTVTAQWLNATAQAQATGAAIAAERTAAVAASQRSQEDSATATALAAQAAQATSAAANAQATAAQATTQARPRATATPAATARPGAVADFEQEITWRQGDQPYGQLDRSSEQVRSGSYAGRLSYNFPATKDNFVVLLAKPPITVAAQPTGLVAWVYGDGSGHFLNAWLQDAAGEVRQYTFGQVSHRGWAQMTAWLDDGRGWPNGHISGPDDGKLGYPVSLYALVLDGIPDGQASTGAVYLDEIATTQGAAPQGSATAVAGATAAATAGAAPAGLSGKIAMPIFATERGTYDIYVGNVDGSNIQRVIDYASEPVLRSDGAQLAFRRWKSDDRGVEVMPTFGGNRKRLTNFYEDALPSFSPNGQTLVFFSRRESDRKSRIYAVNVAGGGDWQPRGAGNPIFGEYPTWMPDGRIVYRTTSPQQGIAIMNADGSGIQMLFPDGSATAPAASSRHIAFMSQRDGSWEVYRMNLDGSGVLRLTANGANDGLPAWSPDGNYLAFVSDRDGSWGVWVTNADGTGQRKLFAMPGSPDGRVAREPDYASRGWTEERIAWGP